MPACPACGTANDTRTKRCSQCGTALFTASFEQAVPATRRMGRTLLGVSPTNPPSDDATLPEDNRNDLQPFAPVPGTLRGLSLGETQSAVADDDNSSVGHVHHPKTLPFGRSQTLTGFGAPNEGDTAVTGSREGPPLASPLTDELSDSPPMGGAIIGPDSTASAGAPTSLTSDLVPAPPEPSAAAKVPAANRAPPVHHGTMMGMPPVHSVEAKRPAPPLNATLVGFASTAEIQPSPAQAEAPTPMPAHARTDNSQLPVKRQDAPFKGTLMGVSPILDQKARGEEPNKATFKGTLLGVSAFIDPNERQQDPSPNQVSDTNANPDQLTQGRGGASPNATMVGISPQMARVHVAPSHVPDHKGTLLGVAIPGIAPLQPGQNKAQAPGVTTAPSQPSPADAAPLLSTLEQTESPYSERKRQRRSLTWIFGSAAAALFILVVVTLAFWWTSVRLKVEVQSGESGGEHLTLTCSNCPDGTTVTMDEKSTTFHANRASMDLTRRLAIGKNQLALHVKRPNRPRAELVNVMVPVDFRASVSLADLAANPPQLSVDLETSPGTQFTVEGKRYAVDNSGKLKVPVDVAAALSGPAPAIVPLERRIEYEVTREGTVTRGTLVVRSGITPLEVTTPGSFHVTQQPTFTLSGKTSPQAKLLANGHSIAVSSNGSFHQEMALSAPGATKLIIRAQEPNQAPRLVEISLERVTNLQQRALELSRPLPSDFDAIKSAAETSPDSMVALHAEVVALEALGALTRIVGSSNCHHRPCLSSIRYGGTLSLRPGDQFMAVGRAKVSARANSSDRDLSLEAGLVVEESRR